MVSSLWYFLLLLTMKTKMDSYCFSCFLNCCGVQFLRCYWKISAVSALHISRFQFQAGWLTAAGWLVFGLVNKLHKPYTLFWSCSTTGHCFRWWHKFLLLVFCGAEGSCLEAHFCVVPVCCAYVRCGTETRLCFSRLFDSAAATRRPEIGFTTRPTNVSPSSSA